MSNLSEKSEINQRLIAIEEKLAAHGIILSTDKEIPYGTQLTGEGSTESGRVSLYHSKKKGLSAVDISKNAISKTICDIFLGNDEKPVKKFRAIIGSDEAGKGDFFGPLVTVAFYIESEAMEQELLDIGIRDSKKLTDKKISEMAFKIKKKWPNHFQIVGPSVEKYNNLYSTIGNLNKLLGWMHGRAIVDLKKSFAEKGTKIKIAVVDKFADKSNVEKSVAGLDDIKIEAITKGEEAEVAIAAASVIARDTFVYKMKMMSKDWGMTFPLGASAKVKEAGTAFVKKEGRDKLVKVCKTHFKTRTEI